MIPAPKFGIGDKVFFPNALATQTRRPCPDCNGTRKWKAIAPSGIEIDMDCPRCARSYTDAALSLTAMTYTPIVQRMTVGKVSAEISGDGTSRVSYMCEETGVGSGSNYREDQLHADEAEAKAIAAAMCAERQAEWDARPAVADEKARAAMGYFAVVRREIRNDLRSEVLREIRNEFPTPEGCTLGPWRVCIESTSRDSRVSWEVIGMSDKGERRPVCSGYGRISDGFPSDDEAIGNAHLIGAAFDLLAACEAALGPLMERECPSAARDLDALQRLADEENRVVAQLRAAITKAKGGAA